MYHVPNIALDFQDKVPCSRAFYILEEADNKNM